MDPGRLPFSMITTASKKEQYTKSSDEHSADPFTSHERCVRKEGKRQGSVLEQQDCPTAAYYGAHLQGTDTYLTKRLLPRMHSEV